MDTYKLVLVPNNMILLLNSLNSFEMNMDVWNLTSYQFILKWHFQNQGWGWRRKTGLSPPVKYFTDRSKAVLLLWIFYVFVLSCVCYVLCASVYMCFVVTCWERADLLALVCGVFCEFVTFPLVSWVRCGTWLYRFLIFATLLTNIYNSINNEQTC